MITVRANERKSHVRIRFWSEFLLGEERTQMVYLGAVCDDISLKACLQILLCKFLQYPTICYRFVSHRGSRLRSGPFDETIPKETDGPRSEALSNCHSFSYLTNRKPFCRRYPKGPSEASGRNMSGNRRSRLIERPFFGTAIRLRNRTLTA